MQQQHTQPIGTAALEPALLAMKSACQAQKAYLLAVVPTCADDNGGVTP